MPFGADEAGKGPALGSMFAAALYVADPSALPEGVADSKRLSPERREELAAALRGDDRVRIGVAEITTERIDDPETDMNGLAVSAHAEAIDGALSGLGGDEPVPGLCDACDTDAARFADRVEAACEAAVAVEAEHAADDADPVVAAASIVAKVSRDAHVATLAEEYGTVGSGYPSDPTTRAYIEGYVADHGELPPAARESWATCADALAAAEQRGLGEF
ncbi:MULTISPECIES: ribonuclease HII [Saliphagus]|uniref:Ribonuclease n=1 Tax=Saliphagus infecundisoli TaxID=1849069 RepID=A0ABD5QIH0_9EURY|nr:MULTISPECIES: ribonuclease HII [Saliphagus]